MYFSDKISNRIFYTAERSIRGGIFDLLAGGIYFVIAVVYKLAYRNKRIAFFLKFRENSVERVGRVFYIVVKEYN